MGAAARVVPRRRIAVAGLLVAGASAGVAGTAVPTAGATGNGISSRPASQIMRAAVAATRSVRSLSLVGALRSNGQDINLNVSLGPGEGSGTVSLGTDSVALVEVNHTLYFKGDAGFWQHYGGSAQAAAALAGRWIAVPASDARFAQFEQFVDAPSLFNGAFRATTDRGSVANKRGPATVHGVPAIKIAVTNNRKPGDDGTAYVATTGQPYILRIVARGTGSSGQLTLSNFNEPVTVTAPIGALQLPPPSASSS